MRVLAMEIMRGLCSDAELIRNLWEHYNALDTGSKAVPSFVTALKRRVSQQMGGIGVQPESSSSSNATGAAGAVVYGLDMAGRVASASVSGVVTMIGSEAGLSSHGSSMKLQCIDQLDKAKAPAIPKASHTFPSLPSCSAKSVGRTARATTKLEFAGKGIGSHTNSHPNNLLVGEATGIDPRLRMYVAGSSIAAFFAFGLGFAVLGLSGITAAADLVALMLVKFLVTPPPSSSLSSS
ncbi:hypothetical protein CVT25_008308 [Psilocybe cyanescens]|uniref:Uncharacterized protein n=1 Tax=Psilocybe cyanescens TaxID=93625 RepID=A0A409WV04_PSICY|nr:hypothetical protein CVT25_008308 [Psilocybe cyanescens]